MRHFPAFLTALFAFLFAGFLSQVQPLNADDLPGKKKSFQGMSYRLFIPDQYDQHSDLPLVFALHGAAGRGSDNRGNVDGNESYKRLTDVSRQSEHPSIVVAPQCPAGKKWVDLPWDTGAYNLNEVSTTAPMKKAFTILNRVVETYRVDRDRIYVTGQSMGGYGTWYAAALHPEWFAAAVPICGAGPPGAAEQMKDVAIWAFHGAKDQVVPVEGSREMVEALQQAGARVKYTEFPDVDHSAYGPAWDRKGDRIVEWLFDQSRDQHD